MVWDYPAALEVIRSEQAAGCVAAVLCGHAACELEAPCHMLHPATAASWGGLSRDTLLSDPLIRRSRRAAQGPARGCGAVVRPVRSRQIRGDPHPQATTTSAGTTATSTACTTVPSARRSTGTHTT